MLLNGLDWLVIGAFFVLLALIPALASLKSKKTASDFFTSGRSMPWWLIGFSMVAATTATDSANFFTEVIRRDGMGWPRSRMSSPESQVLTSRIEALGILRKVV